MSTDQYVDELREARKSPQTLKVRLAAIRSRDPTVAVLIFESKEDACVYESWLKAVDLQVKYEPIGGDGKGQLLAFRQALGRDKSEMGKNTYFFVDRDYDDLRGQLPGPDLFVTDMYALENYFVADETLSSLIRHDLGCLGNEGRQAALKSAIDSVLHQLIEVLFPINLRIYTAVKLAVSVKKETNFNKYVRVDLTNVHRVFADADVPNLVALGREVTAEEVALAEDEFRKLDPITRHRGKFLWACLSKWVAVVWDDGRAETPQLATHLVGKKAPHPASITTRSLAGRSAIPHGLREFAGTIVSG